jgi:hypothetical protein
MKKYLLTVVTIFIFFSAESIFAQIQGNSFFIDSSTKNYTLKDNEGKREVFVEMNFAKPFANKPTVLASISLLDITGEKYDIQPNMSTTIENKGLKIAVEATGVSRDGFVLKVTVWGKTQINAVGGSWFAFEQ